jgi:hypothetical protein
MLPGLRCAARDFRLDEDRSLEAVLSDPTLVGRPVHVDDGGKRRVSTHVSRAPLVLGIVRVLHGDELIRKEDRERRVRGTGDVAVEWEGPAQVAGARAVLASERSSSLVSGFADAIARLPQGQSSRRLGAFGESPGIGPSVAHRRGPSSSSGGNGLVRRCDGDGEVGEGLRVGEAFGVEGRHEQDQ